MPGPDDKDKTLKMPPGVGQQTTPYGTPTPAEASTEFALDEPTLEPLRQRYELLDELGRGGMGAVYKARDRETGDVVGLKVILPEIAARPDLIERFKSELLLARRITHKNVCRVYDLNRFGDVAAISMEYVEGESLRAALKREQGVSLRYGLEVLHQVIAGLAEAHAQGVVHRDLKPENILIANDGSVKVMDFGIARSVESDATQTGTGMLIGTPAYMSPEQAEGKPADARSDIYSLGLVMYEMFTGQLVFRADTPAALAVKHLHETPPPPSQFEPHLPAFLDRAIQKCLEKNPRKRFQSMPELEAALSEKPAAGPGVAERAEVPLPVHLTRWQRSDWLLMVAALGGLALFFSFFERASLAPRHRITFDHSVLRRITQDYAERVGARLPLDSDITVWSFLSRYDYLARTLGGRKAIELADNPIPYVFWEVTGAPAEDLQPTEVRVDDRGSLLRVSRGFPKGLAPEQLSLEETRPVAEQALRDFFDRDPSLLRLDTSATDTWQGYAANSFTWSDPEDIHGIIRRYDVRLVGKEAAFLEARFDLPAGQFWKRGSVIITPIGAVLGFALVILGFLQRKRVNLRARWRIVFVSVALTVGASVGWALAGSQSWFAQLLSLTGIGLLTAVSWFGAFMALEWAIRNQNPARISTLERLFGRGAATAPCGLALLRGSLLGLALLGTDRFLLWISLTRLDTWLRGEVHLLLMGGLLTSWSPAFWTLLSAFVLSLGTGCFSVGFWFSFSANFLRRAWLAAVVVALVTALSGFVGFMGSIQPAFWGGVVVFLLSLFLAWIFSRYDLLTLLMTLFTFGFCWANYSLLVMLDPIGAFGQWLAFALWALFVLAAAAVAFQSALRAARRRLAAAFE